MFGELEPVRETCQSEDRLLNSVLLDAGVKLGAQQAQKAGRPGFVALGLVQGLLDQVTLDIHELQAARLG